MGLKDKVDSSQKSRAIFVYTLPDALQNGITSVGLVQLSAHEELQAVKRARNDTHQLAYELAQQSLVEINGKTVKLEDGSVDSAFNGMNPQVRNLVLTAYAKLHAPAEDMTESFLSSQSVKVQ